MTGFFESLKLGFGAQRVPMLLQTEAAECGLASLAMVASYHGLHTDMPTLRQRFQLSLKGVTMVDLTRIAGQMQLNPRALRAEMEDLSQRFVRRRPRPAGHPGHRLRVAGVHPGGDRRDPLMGRAVPVGHAESAVARQRVRAPDAPAGRLVRETPHRRCDVALRRGPAD